MYTGYSVFFDHSYASSLSDLVSKVNVSKLSNPNLVCVNQPLLSELGIDKALFYQPELFKNLFEINGLFNKNAVAQKYGGHQFGMWNPDLGDGRGLLIAEVVDPQQRRWDLHLKGAGKTPYSRFGDGKAVLRSTIREYLASEALHHLGIPSSRALCLIDSDETVYRETAETGAMLVRVCQSHIRFGHFEYFHHAGQQSKLQALMDYTLQTHYPEFLSQPNPHFALLQDITLRTAQMVAKWQAQGFCHGVMNTDNMSIHGITFDYGPYAFLDIYEPGYICNHSDHQGRYAFDQQPGVALWNLNALAHGFTSFISIDQIKQALTQFEPELQRQFGKLMSHKLGFAEADDDVMQLVNRWLNLLAKDRRDYAQSFRLLAKVEQDPSPIIDHFIDRQSAELWARDYLELLNQRCPDISSRQERMRLHNPKFILRNYLAQNAIDAAQNGDFSCFERLLEVLASPFDEHPEHEELANTPPDWGLRMEISCSS